MKSISNQYKDVKNGLLTESQFIRNVRMMKPGILSGSNTFLDSIRILKQRGLLNEDCDSNEYNMGMRYEIEQGTDPKKAHTKVEKNIEKNPKYYSQLFLHGYDETAYKKFLKEK
jgi:hypothetical protein